MDRCKLHPLDFILLIVFTSTLSGCNSWYDIEDYAEHWQEDLKKLYKSLTGKDIIHGIPSHDSLNRAIGLLEPAVFEEAYCLWLESFVQLTTGSHICIDGKSMRGVRKLSFDAQSHTVSAYSPKELVSIAQVYIDKKDSEINAIEVLIDKLDLEGNLISIDAIGTQTSLAKTITARGGDYLLPVKDNQLHSKQELEEFFCPHFAKHIIVNEQTELGHGRIETRRYESIVSPLELEASSILSRWAGLASIHKVTRIREDKKTGKKGQEVTYYIASSTDLEAIHKAIREHWAIENKLHYCLDVFLLQDDSRKRARNAPQIMDLIQKINLYLLQRIKQAKKSSVRRMMLNLGRMSPSQIIDLKF